MSRYLCYALTVLLLMGCDEDDSPTASAYSEELPPLADEVPWDTLGEGTIFFRRTLGGRYAGAYLVDVDARASRRVQQTFGSTLAISPALDRIVDMRWASTDLLYGDWALYASDLDGKHSKIISNLPGRDSFPVWKFDGSGLYFTVVTGIQKTLWFQSPAENTYTRRVVREFIYEREGSLYPILPRGFFASASDGRLACTFDPSGGVGTELAGLNTLNEDGSGLTRILEGSPLRHPAFSPDAATIAYLDVTQNVVGRIPALGGTPMESDPPEGMSVDIGEESRALAWSPDGTKLLVVLADLAEPSNGTHLYVLDILADEWTPVTTLIGASDGSIAWLSSPEPL